MSSPPPRLFTFRSGGWVILLTSLASLALITWAIAPAVLRQFSRPPGDLTNIESYRFALEPCLVERDLIIPITIHRDMVPVMTDPQTMRGADIDAYNQAQRGKFIVPSDRVIGVTIGDESRAYPVDMLYVHEIIHDTLADVPIAVTYHWPCDSVRVFERTLEGEAVVFGVSGLLYNSNLLMFIPGSTDPGGDTHVPESLWCQIPGRAISGPDAAEERTLKTIPAQLTSWSVWLERHPETTVVMKDPALAKRYQGAEPAQYFLSPDLIAPASPLPIGDEPGLKAKVIAVRSGEAGRIYPLSFLQTKLEAKGTWTDTMGEISIRFESWNESTRTVLVIPQGEDVDFIHGYHFAIHAMYPELSLVR